MLVLGDCLFTHGAVRSGGLLLLPAEDCRDGELHRQPPPLRLPDDTPLNEWAMRLNEWKQRQVSWFEAFPKWVQFEGGERWRGGQPLMMPSLSGCRVMIDGYLQQGNMAILDEDVAAYLSRNGCRRLFAGHQPHGQCPGVLRHPRSGITVVVADTSFSDGKADKSANAADTRGAAVSTVLVTRNSTRVAGVLADGTCHRYELQLQRTQDSPLDALVGCRFTDGSWGKTVVGEQLQLCRGEGFVQHLQLVPLQEAIVQLDDIFK